MDTCLIQITEQQDKRLTISVAGRISSTNIAEVEQQLTQLIQENSHEQLTIDASKMEYLSSAGLRLFLKIRKAEFFQIVNVSPEVYDIFEMTGFTKLLDIHKAFREISVEGCKLLGSGINGSVYRLDEETIVKLYNPNAPLDIIQRERDYAQTAFINDVPTAISYDVVKCGDCLGIVFELINADTFNHKLHGATDDFDKYAKQYVDILLKMHHATVKDNQLPKMKDVYHQWINDVSRYYSEEEIALMHQMVEGIPDCNTIIHGDFHPRNLMTQGEELLLIDMADVSQGHPIFDFAGIGLTHQFYPTESPDTCMHFIGLEAEELKRLWWKVLSFYFNTEDQSVLQAKHEQIMPYVYLRYAVNPAIITHLPEEMKLNSVRVARENLFPTIKENIGKVAFLTKK